MKQLRLSDHVVRMGTRKETIEKNAVLYGEISLLTKHGIIQIYNIQLYKL
jgi:hypothetical protein